MVPLYIEVRWFAGIRFSRRTGREPFECWELQVQTLPPSSQSCMPNFSTNRVSCCRLRNTFPGWMPIDIRGLLVTFLSVWTRCVSIFPDQQGFAVGSIEGRVGIEYFSEQQAKQQAQGGFKPVSTYGATKLSFAFKCHRVTVSQHAGLSILILTGLVR